MLKGKTVEYIMHVLNRQNHRNILVVSLCILIAIALLFNQSRSPICTSAQGAVHTIKDYILSYNLLPSM